MTILKSVRAQIILGAILLDVFRLPDGSYSFSSSGIAELLGLSSHKRVGEILTSKALKPKTAMALKLGISDNFKLVLPKVSADVGNINAVSMDLFMLIVNYEAFANGNKMASAILEAALAESLERRADAAFGVLRTEEERNLRHRIRVDGIVSRYFWTDIIDQYIRTHEVSDNYRRFIYINVSDAVNKAILGTTAKKYRETNDIPEEASLRDYLTTEQLKQIDTIEKAAGMRVIKNDLCPKQALKDVIGLIC